jgi:preprotein translocase subunit SecF
MSTSVDGAGPAATAPSAGLGARLYRGETSFDFVGRVRTWAVVSVALLLVSLGAVVLRGLELGIEFTGGAQFSVTAPTVGDSSVPAVRDAVTGIGIAGVGEPIVTIVGGDRLQVRTGAVTTDEAAQVRDVVAAEVGVGPNDVTSQVVGPSWGGEITRKAGLGLMAFLAFIAVYLSIAFEWRMAVSALVALVHDIVATVGVYALVGFDVTPATVIGLLTILGYSLYDTVVVFDKVRENTRGIHGQSRQTYAEAANLAVNQTVVRSVITTVVALLPIGAILFVGAGLLGAGTLKDFALVLFVGVAVGTYSSIFVATPLLAWLHGREAQVQALERRVAARRSGRTAPAGSTARTGARTSTGRPDAGDELADGAAIEDDSSAGTAGGPDERPRPARTVRPVGGRAQPQRRTRQQRRSGPGNR